MRKGFILLAAIVACSKTETPATDTAATAAAPTPAALTVADLQGTWNGTSTRTGTDSTLAWTITSVTDSTAKLVFAGSKDSVMYTTRVDADSMIAMSAPYMDPEAPKDAPAVMFRSVGRLKDGKLAGTVAIVLASKPDSVVGTGTWEATKAP